MKRNWIFIMVAAFFLAIASGHKLFARPMGHYGYWRLVEEIAKDTSTPQKKAEVVQALLDIMQDGMANVHLRRFAVEKLGEIGDSEAIEPVRALAGRLQWTDGERQLKRAASLAYWQIMVRQEKTAEAQEDLLIKLLWGNNHLPPHADVIPWWAAEELANRGVKRALPEIERSIMSRDPTGTGKRFVQLCLIKIQLISSSGGRLGALQRALGNNEDPSIARELRRWAIAELARLNTEQAHMVLVNHALVLQDTYYDSAYRLKTKLMDPCYMEAADDYNQIIDVLRKTGLGDRVSSFGLQPDKCFVMAP